MKPGGNSGGLLAVAILAIILGTLSLTLRLYTRKVVLNQMWLDDYMAIVSWICLMALAAQNFHNISTGLGSHFDEIPPSVLPAFFLDLWIGLVIYQITLLFTKLTLFFQFYRIVRQTTWRRLKICYIVIMSIIAGWQVAQIFVQIFACIPVQASWDKTIMGKCQSIRVSRDMNSIANIVTDFIILILPLPVIWRLALPRNQKIALSSIFGLGFFTCIVSILRITTTPGGEADIAWETVKVVAWTTAEVLTGVIIASVTTLRPLIGRYVPAWATRAMSKGTAGTSGASYKLGELPSQATSGPSRSEPKSMLIYPSRRFSSGGWLDLSESGEDAGVRAPEAAHLDARSGPLQGNIRVTKEWTVIRQASDALGR